MNAADDEDDALPVVDLAVWRGVLTGLNLMRIALLATAWSSLIIVPTALIAIRILVRGNLTGGVTCVVVAGLWLLLMAMIFVQGAWWCCSAPPHSGVRRYALAFSVMAYTTIAIVMILFAITAASLVARLPGFLVSVLSHASQFEGFIFAALLLQAILSAACWIWMLEAIARSLGLRRLADGAATAAYLLFIFEGGWVLMPIAQDFQLDFVHPLALYYILALVALPIGMVWVVCVLLDMRNRLERALRSP